MPRVLARLALESISPISLGGYDTKMTRNIDGVQIEEPFRLSSLKGAWRWWMRAYLAGVAYDKGLDEKCAVKKVGEILGSTKTASKFGIKILWSSIEDYRVNLENIRNIPRLRLLYTEQLALLRYIHRKQYDKVKKRTLELLEETEIPIYEDILNALEHHNFQKAEKILKEYILNDAKRTFKKIRVKLILYERLGATLIDDERILSVGSLITALKFGGIGKISRRGFGSLKIDLKNSSYQHNVKNIFEAVKKIESQSDDINENGIIAKGIKELIRLTYSSARRLLLNKASSHERSLLPQIPAISKNKDALSIFLFKSSSLEKVGRSLVRTELNSLVGSLIGIKHPQQRLRRPLGWILGLPRSVRSTGYFVVVKKDQKEKEDVGRRASPLIFSQLNDHVWTATFIVSTDYPIKLISKGRRRKPIDIEFNRLSGQINIRSPINTLDVINVIDVINIIKNWIRNNFRATEVRIF